MFRRAILTLWTIVVACAVVFAQSTAAPPTQTPPPAAPRQGQPDPQQPIFRTRVDSISVDVTVTDKQGNPVTDLKPEEFEIREAGKVQSIDSFRFIKMETTEARGVEPPRQILSMSEMARETANPQNRLFIVFLDDYHTRESNSLFIRKELARWVQGLTSHDLVALLYPWQDATAATFSRDHDGTAAAIMKFTGRKYDYRSKTAYEDGFAHYPPEYQEQIRNDLTIRTLQSACAVLAATRDGRKTLLYVSEGMFATLPAGVRTNSNSSPPMTGGTNQKSPQESSYDYFRSSDLLIHMRDIFQVAARGNTAIYTLDPRGLAPSEFGVADSVGTDADRAILTESTDVLRIIADETNGRAIVGKNNPFPELQKMVEDVSAYYLLGTPRHWRRVTASSTRFRSRSTGRTSRFTRAKGIGRIPKKRSAVLRSHPSRVRRRRSPKRWRRWPITSSRPAAAMSCCGSVRPGRGREGQSDACLGTATRRAVNRG